MKKTILLIGTLPPPVGGVTIHLERFFEINKKNKFFDLFLLDIRKKCIYYNDGCKKIINILNVFFRADLIHIHISNNFKIVFALIAKLFFKKIIYTHHNSRINNNLLFKIFITLCDYLIFVNENFVVKNKHLFKNKPYKIIPAFIQPRTFEALPENLTDQIQRSSFTISTNCAIDVYFENKLMYGFDLLIAAFIKLANSNRISNSLLLLIDPAGNLERIVSSLLGKNEILNNCKIMYVPKKIDFSSLIKKSDLIVRATRTDGDSLTVREALFFRKPIIASDCAERPIGTILFQNDNSDDLSRKIEDVFNNQISNTSELKDFNDQVLKIYEIF